MRTYLFFIAICCSYCSCSNRDSTGKFTTVTTIDFSGVDKSHSGKFGDYFEVEKVIQLETDSASMLAEVTKVGVYDSSLFVFDRKYSALKVFDFYGKYKFSIGKIGQGEGEFTKISDFSLNEFDRTIWLYSDSGRGIMVYSFDGKFVKKIQLPFFAYYMSPIDKNSIAFYINFNESERVGKNNLVITDSDGEIVKMLAPYKSSETHAFGFTGYVAHNRGGVLFGKAFNDTLYQINGNGDVLPKYHLDFDVSKSRDWESFPVHKQNFETRKDWTFVQSGFVETDKVLSFTLAESMTLKKYFYFKRDSLLLSEDYFRKGSFARFLNQPRSFYGNTLISMLNSEYFLPSRNPELLSRIKEESAEMFAKLSTHKETDNPIIVFFQPKMR
ncbi:hypothetical protein SAMN05216327_118148 [Dyadobacter sp. SG02]|uniref:6-bladed beta-propeller n=1 Tax=Dyadobacter sp. SG02 TaxID=1855291 RepID=UPI0008AB4E1B|nr:6-bladed beta-propeller [Dyadobacter sp. SG02]SEJ75853.1 hypothetical protein SAMN05216327_118148 [Dyadobacter sp. SG02]